MRIDTSASPALLRTSVLVMLFALLAQFLAGMAVNIYVVLPPEHAGSSDGYLSGAVTGVAWAITGGAPAIALHTGLGLLLAIGAVALLLAAWRSGQRAWVVSSLLGLIGIVAGGAGGIGFLNYGKDYSTFVMAIGFSLCVGAYMAVLITGQPSVVGEVTREE